MDSLTIRILAITVKLEHDHFISNERKRKLFEELTELINKRKLIAEAERLLK